MIMTMEPTAMTMQTAQASVRLTVGQALVRYLAALQAEVTGPDGETEILPYCAGVFAIFGHGNVTGLGAALEAEKDRLPTLRAHSEQGMANAAVAFAKAHFRQRIMAVTSSIGPGATNMLTSAALAHVARLPLLLLPGDVFVSRLPDPVLQQLESFEQGELSVNDCFRPVTRYFDRITAPEQLLVALPRAIQVMTDPAQCGPVCLALPQDVQTFACDWPLDFFQPARIRLRRPPADAGELAAAGALLRSAKRPLIVAGGGVLYSQAWDALRAFAQTHGVPVAESQAGKGSLAWDLPLNLGAIGVTGSPAANRAAGECDLVLAVGTRLQDFTTGSHALYARARLLSLNVQPLDAGKKRGQQLVADARTGLEQLSAELAGWRADPDWTAGCREQAAAWVARVTQLTTRPPENALPYEAEVIGAVRESAADAGLDSARNDIVVCAAGTLPAELHKLWRSALPGNYHMDYAYSCMGYEVAGGLGVKLARPEREVIVIVGDGSYMMLNSELATSVLLGRKIIVVLLDNRGFGCIERLQTRTGGASFNNLLDACVPEGGTRSAIDYALHGRALGADAVHVRSVEELRREMRRARAATQSQLLVIDTTHQRTTDDGGAWWEVAVPQVSPRPGVAAAQRDYLEAKTRQRR
ncbi:3D-(3,5/4)-trihydroxycyclohexane-1,2-dione acylhydrolase (decyclizing) [Verminephrobacter aporrectodeae subsp. tuberculatae]|uniref:3D-(3,5/4)-trihydroxycyclohexane-1,2-dione acylhydrolase (decyclizing) n=2 Tax=Verminephrobacter aporrectodeae TaxID=1110389 RepID=UPI002243AAB9|nr:3D-(3,5/4)-trihydroxycyclohexane-1,2-dione acylhydrolase (decyclizing) [Verminephrobacter aporrectodeae]MCW8164428.1 3D-(3,5/4)-trihydroxycyclohexane-1,2-dione acylhydrolase (decyclizing) [Verminephrobacter aporrectodeae subsp. tuberculatae]MCW8169318.1 3D-(3,5/4)-trihydroxycyclohexane-1,2-dione acylhydrolase (decyclizing) [Verminephrobacter aporrectodeae subsp. tuberculatae]